MLILSCRVDSGYSSRRRWRLVLSGRGLWLGLLHHRRLPPLTPQSSQLASPTATQAPPHQGRPLHFLLWRGGWGRRKQAESAPSPPATKPSSFLIPTRTLRRRWVCDHTRQHRHQPRTSHRPWGLSHWMVHEASHLLRKRIHWGWHFLLQPHHRYPRGGAPGLEGHRCLPRWPQVCGLWWGGWGRGWRLLWW